MRIACLGGGPAGLCFAISIKRRRPDADIVVFERNRPDETFGWGGALPDELLDTLAANGPDSATAIRAHVACRDPIAVHHRGARVVSTGRGVCGIGRKRLLILLQERARALGVDLRFEREIDPASDAMRDVDLVVASDGLNSGARKAFETVVKPDIDHRACRFVWLGAHQTFDDAFTFILEVTERGWVWARAHQFDADTAAFILETDQATWAAYGFGEMTQADSIAVCARIFRDHLDGHALMSNAAHLRGSAWLTFRRVLCDRWSDETLVLMGDAAASAHFFIGSGAKLALESAIALADHVVSEPSPPAAFAKYEDERRTEVLKLPSAARNSLEWFADLPRRLHRDPVQFACSLPTRSQRISHETLRLRGMELKNRVAVSPMAQSEAGDGSPTDWRLVHLGERAKGGAGLSCTEMTCVSAEGRITPGCPGLHAPEHEAAWRRVVDFVHAETDAKIRRQIGHAGRKGSTELGWEEMDAPLAEGNWEIVSASPIPWSERNAVARGLDGAGMDEIRDQFAAAAEMAERAGFDMIGLHAAHGHLISSFIPTLSKVRTDAYGGSLENRMRWPLAVFRAMRAVWSEEKPMSARISASDRAGDDGVTAEESVEIARMFREAGADIVDVSAGRASTPAKPVDGRMFQTPSSDRIRNEARVPAMAVGTIHEADHVNAILMAGRADLVRLARPHLSDPYRTPRAGARIGDRHAEWPDPYLAGRDQLWRLADKDAAEAARV